MKTIKQIILSIIGLTTCFNAYSQSITQLPNDPTTLNYSAVFSGNGFDANGTSCYFSRAKGMLSIGIQVQHNGTATWQDNTVYFKIKNTGNAAVDWIPICRIFNGPDNSAFGGNYFSTAHYTTSGNYYTSSTNVLPSTGSNAPHVTAPQVSHSQGGSQYMGQYLYNYGNLKIYNGNYNFTTGSTTRNNAGDYANYNLQTLPWSASYRYPVKNPAISSGVQGINNWYDIGHANPFVGNIEGVSTFEYSPGVHVLVINIVNLPPEMLESSTGFRVHLAQESNTTHDRVYEWAYGPNDVNFMTAAPQSLTVTKNLCGQAKLTWANAFNTLPTDGQVDIKTAIFRDGIYLNIVDDNITTYSDNTAAQDVEYDYTLRHIAFSESGKTYFKSPATAPIKGSVKPSPDEPISPSASIDKCNSKIDISWSYNGVNPDRFRID